MAQYRVVCITKCGEHHNPHERISHLGTTTASGTSVHS